jgi:hypothetical protein
MNKYAKGKKLKGKAKSELLKRLGKEGIARVMKLQAYAKKYKTAEKFSELSAAQRAKYGSDKVPAGHWMKYTAALYDKTHGVTAPKKKSSTAKKSTAKSGSGKKAAPNKKEILKRLSKLKFKQDKALKEFLVRGIQHAYKLPAAQRKKALGLTIFEGKFN